MNALILSFALIAVESAASSTNDVTASLLDGGAITGRLTGWEGDHILVTTDERAERLPTDHLVGLRWSPAKPAHVIETPNGPQVELTDGSILPISEFEVTGTVATVKLVGPRSESIEPLSFPLNHIASVRLQPLDSKVEEQWLEIRDQNLPSDVVVVFNRDGTSVDYAEGVLGDVTANKVEFKLAGDSVRADRARVAGLMYHRRDKPQGDTRCIVHGRTGLQARAAKVHLAGHIVEIATNAGVTFPWPLDDVYFADFSAGKIVYLSDLEPASQQWTPMADLPADAPLATQYGQPVRDQSAFGGPLALLVSDSEAVADSRHLKRFSKGLALRSRTELVYRLPAGYRQFTALAGIDAAASAAANVRLSIFGDDRPIFEADLAGQQLASEIQLDIADIRRLKIVVEYGVNLDTGDWLNLCDARLLK